MMKLRSQRSLLPALLLSLGAAVACATHATEFSVTPIRVELKPGVLTETITVTNHTDARLRVSMKLTEWTQDAAGKDVYSESADLVYFPRQMEIAPKGKRLVRVGVSVPAAVAEKTYRLWVEEEPDASATQGRAQVAFYFRFGVPVFVVPPTGKAQPEVMEPSLAQGKVAVVVRNPGNQHFRLTRVAVSSDAGYSTDISGWYSLAGSERTYTLEIPREACIKARTLGVTLEGEGFRVERKLNVDPMRCA